MTVYSIVVCNVYTWFDPRSDLVTVGHWCQC